MFLVEMAVVETASENLSGGLSTSVAFCLEFPSRNAERQALRYGSPVGHDGLQDGYPFTFTANRRLYPGRSTPGKDGCFS